MRDTEYWDEFYAKAHPDIAEPSTFAQFCIPRLSRDAVVYELGCGNGRDVQFFAANGLRVLACDRSHVAIERLRGRVSGNGFRHEPDLRVADMSALSAEFRNELDVVYSRFTLHAVTSDEASAALAWSYASLRPAGRLFAEARSVKGSLYGKGEEVARDTFLYNGHRRRFLRSDELVAELTGLGFAIDELIEADGLTPHGDDDPVVIRVIARKPEATVG